MHKLKHLIIFVIIITFVLYKINRLLISSFDVKNIPIKTINSVMKVPSNEVKNVKTNETKLYKILLWTPYFGSDSWSKVSLNALKCEYSNCLLTADRNELDKSDALLFHWRDIDNKDLPKYHLSDQKWILYNWESPHYSPINKIMALKEQINWTMSYRYDSDIFVPYGRIQRCHNKYKSHKYAFNQKKNSIAWIVSNCETESKRELYANQLSKYIDIHLYGSCGQLECNYDSSCYQMIAKNYKFYLSFENSLCKDYVTEKLFRIIQYDIIPIVLGSANYRKFMPENSFINTMDFSSAKDLAKHLKDISSDEHTYNSYFKWKNNFCISETNYTYFCDLCQKLNNPSSVVHKNDNRSDLINWWFKEANCLTPNYSTNIYHRNYLFIIIVNIFCYLCYKYKV